MITSPQDTLLNESVAIFCQVNGFPVPSILWQKDGVELNSMNISGLTIFSFQPVLINGSGSSDFESPSFNGNISDLIIINRLNVASFNTMDSLGLVGVLYFNNVVREDTSNYHCTASNELSETRLITTQSAMVSLTILGKVILQCL